MSEPTPPARVSRTGNPLLKPASGPPALTKRHLALIRFMVFGIDQPYPRWPDVQPHMPLDVNTAADIACIRRKNARDLFNWPIFMTEYNRCIASLRRGEHARSVHTMIAVRDDPGAGKAADRKVQLAASAMILGELGGSGSSVTINNNVGVTLQAGIVIDLREDDLPTIEHEATT